MEAMQNKADEMRQASQLQTELYTEKMEQKRKRDLEREQARLVIIENEAEKRKRMALLEEAKKKDADLIIEEMRNKEL